MNVSKYYKKKIDIGKMSSSSAYISKMISFHPAWNFIGILKLLSHELTNFNWSQVKLVTWHQGFVFYSQA